MRIAVSRAPGAERVVTPLELFFDLVYVFAIGQLSHHLLEHVDLRTGAETAIMALAVVYAWYMVAWGANWLDPGRLPVQLLLVGLMFASLLMSAAIPDAFDGRAWLFVTGYLVIQIGRSLFLIVALRGRALGEHVVNDLVWEVLTGVLWVAGAIATATRASCSGESRSWPPTAARGPCTGCPAVAGPSTQVLFMREALGRVSRSRTVGVAALAILAVATAPLTLIVGIAASAAVLVAVAVAVADTVHEDETP